MGPDNQNSFVGGPGVSPNMDSTPSQQPKKRWPFSRTATIIGGVVLGIVIIALLFVFGGGMQSKKKAVISRDNDPSLYVSRPGFSHDNAIGDATPLVQVPASIVQYHGQNVMQACSVVELKDVSDAGLYVAPSPIPGDIDRTFFDGKGAAQIDASDDFNLPSDDQSNTCLYKFQEKGFVAVNVYQDAYTNADALNKEIRRRYTAAPDAHGVQVFTQNPIKPITPSDVDPNLTGYLLRSGNTAVRISMDSSNVNGKNKLLNAIEANFAAALNTPTPLSLFEYKSPVFTKPVTMACDLTDNNTVKVVTGSDASPLAHEAPGSAIGVINQGNNNVYNYIDSSCDRLTVTKYSSDASRIKLTAETYEDVNAAKHAFAYAKSGPFTKDIISTPSTLGDESFFGDTATMEHSVVFRKGRVVVYTSYDLPINKDSSLPAAQRLQALMPAMAQIVSNVKNY